MDCLWTFGTYILTEKPRLSRDVYLASGVSRNKAGQMGLKNDAECGHSPTN